MRRPCFDASALSASSVGFATSIVVVAVVARVRRLPPVDVVAAVAVVVASAAAAVSCSMTAFRVAFVSAHSIVNNVGHAHNTTNERTGRRRCRVVGARATCRPTRRRCRHRRRYERSVSKLTNKRADRCACRACCLSLIDTRS